MQKEKRKENISRLILSHPAVILYSSQYKFLSGIINIYLDKLEGRQVLKVVSAYTIMCLSSINNVSIHS
jgi:hypothetical protein